MRNSVYFGIPPSVLPPNRIVVAPSGERIATISIEENGQVLVGKWQGYCTPENVMLGMTNALQMLREHPCPAMLSDGSQAAGDWSDLVPWMQYDLLPQVILLGVHYTANVRSRDAAARLAHVEYAQFASEHLTIKLFDDPSQAWLWLRQMLQQSSGTT